MECSPPGSFVYEISQARILEWVSISFSRRSPQPGDLTHGSRSAGRFFTTEPPGKPVLNAATTTPRSFRGIFSNIKGFPGGSEGKESACIAGDLGSIPGLGRCPGGGHGSPLQYSRLENPMDRGGGQQSTGLQSQT